jgi:hypothetical protein
MRKHKPHAILTNSMSQYICSKVNLCALLFNCMTLTVNRSIDTSSFPTIGGDISFSVVEKGERSNVCNAKPEAYVIDTQSDWNTIAEKKLSVDCNGNNRDSPLPAMDLNNNTLIAYFWGQKPNSANSFSIESIEADPKTSSIIINLEFKDGFARALSYPYIITSITKTSYLRFVFEEQHYDLFGGHNLGPIDSGGGRWSAPGCP